MSLYDVMFKIEKDTKAGSFITKDGRVIFVGGPGSGGGSSEGGSLGGGMLFPEATGKAGDANAASAQVALSFHFSKEAPTITEIPNGIRREFVGDQGKLAIETSDNGATYTGTFTGRSNRPIDGYEHDSPEQAIIGTLLEAGRAGEFDRNYEKPLPAEWIR